MVYKINGDFLTPVQILKNVKHCWPKDVANVMTKRGFPKNRAQEIMAAAISMKSRMSSFIGANQEDIEACCYFYSLLNDKSEQNRDAKNTFVRTAVKRATYNRVGHDSAMFNHNDSYEKWQEFQGKWEREQINRLREQDVITLCLSSTICIGFTGRR